MRMTSRPFTALIFVTVASVFSSLVEGFAAPPLSASSGCNSARHTATTVLQYTSETNFKEDQYQRSFPNDVKIVDVEVEKHSEFVYIPMNEMDDAFTKAQENHEQECANMQDTINKQRDEIKNLRERNQKSDLTDEMLQCDHLKENAQVNWGENHEDKMKRTTERVRYLTIENQRLQTELNQERDRFEFEKVRLQQKLEEARDATAEAQQILGLERSYFETASRLLEMGLERETNNVKALKDQLLQYDQHGYDDHPYHDDLPQFETWEATGAYEQPDHHDQFHHPHHRDEVFVDFQPQVTRPHEENPYYHQGGHVHSQHELFQHQEPHSFYGQHNGRTSSVTDDSTRRPPTATTTVMDADSIRANLGTNNIRGDPLYR